MDVPTAIPNHAHLADDPLRAAVDRTAAAKRPRWRGASEKAAGDRGQARLSAAGMVETGRVALMPITWVTARPPTGGSTQAGVRAKSCPAGGAGKCSEARRIPDGHNASDLHVK
jgi:hypothetical protein